MKYTLKIEEQEFTVEIENLRARPITAIVDGTRFEIWPEAANNIPVAPPTSKITLGSAAAMSTGATLSAPSLATSLAQNEKTVRAPIPGVIIETLVKPGDEVQPGLELCIIEAMKMRNTIRSNRTGQVAEIHVTPGQTVNYGAPLITFSD